MSTSVTQFFEDLLSRVTEATVAQGFNEKIVIQVGSATSLIFENVRGIVGLKEATVTLAGKEINLAVCDGLTHAKKALEHIQSGEKAYHIVELMACPGGCIMGGGQPYPPFHMEVLDPKLAKLRAKALYMVDSNKQLRRSHENPAITKLYEEYIGEPNGEKAHELLHTHYHARMPRGIR